MWCEQLENSFLRYFAAELPSFNPIEVNVRVSNATKFAAMLHHLLYKANLLLLLSCSACALIAQAPSACHKLAQHRPAAASRTASHRQDITAMAATSTAVDSESTTNTPNYSNFDWHDHWYPVAWMRDLPGESVRGANRRFEEAGVLDIDVHGRYFRA